MKKILLLLFYLCIIILGTITHLVATRVSVAHFVMSKIWQPPKHIEEVLDAIFPSDYIAVRTEDNISRLNLLGQINFWRSINEVEEFGVVSEGGVVVNVLKFSLFFTNKVYHEGIAMGGCKLKINNVSVNYISIKHKKEFVLFVPFEDPQYVISVSYTHLTLPTTPYV